MADRPSSTAGPLSRRAVLAAGGTAVASLAGCLVHGEDSGLRGQVIIDGSNTVLPHSAALAEEFLWRNNRVNIPVRGSGTGAGFQRFCDGTTDLQNASRPITDSEADQCEDAGIDYLELPALRDGIAILAHPDNDWCEDLTVDELVAIWESGSDIETWADIRPGAGWPDRELGLYGRDPASGTFDSFTERLMGEAGNIRDDYSATADTNVIVRGVSGNRDALGWGGAGFYYENEADLKLIGVDDPAFPDRGPVIPTTETIEAGTYTPLSRDMFVYLNTGELDREAVRAFASFYFEPIEDEVRERAVADGIADPDERLTWTQWAARKVGYYAATDEMVEQSHDELRTAIETHQ